MNPTASAIRYIILGAASLCATPAFADAVGYNDVTYERFQSEFFNRGVNVRSFVVKPVISVEEMCDSNIYRSENNTVSDMITLIKPNVSAESRWSTHSLNMKIASELGRYRDRASENYDDVQTELNGRLDIMRGFYITGNTQYLYSHADRGLPDNTTGKEPNIYSEMISRVGVTRDLTRISVMVDGELRQLRYENNETVTGTPINYSDNDYKQYGLHAQVGYELFPGTKAFVRSTLNQVRYDKNTGVDRDSKGFSQDIGMEFNTGNLKGQAYVGYLRQDYDNVDYGRSSGLDYGLSLAWRLSGLTTLRLSGVRSINETLLAGSPGFLQSTVNFGVDHQLLRSLLLHDKLSLINNGYRLINRKDNILENELGLRYYLNDYVALKAEYLYTQQDSNVVNGSYKDNRFLVGMLFGL